VLLWAGIYSIYIRYSKDWLGGRVDFLAVQIIVIALHQLYQPHIITGPGARLVTVAGVCRRL